MCAPGTDGVLVALFGVWADLLGGRLAMRPLAPRVPVTLDLAVHVPVPPPPTSVVRCSGRIVKAGRSVVVIGARFHGDTGTLLATATAGFMAAGDPSLVMPEIAWPDPDDSPRRPPLPGTVAEHIGCRLRAPGVAEVDRDVNGLNSSNTVNGGLLALAVEHAALSLYPGAGSALNLRYLRPVRVGPGVATATALGGGMCEVEVVDAGARHKLAIQAVTRSFAAA
jgi:acyl-coenzyme A thioesterase PaaI-like protein